MTKQARPAVKILMVIEGEIATTQLLERVLLACRPFGVSYTKVHLAELTPDHLSAETLPLFVRCGDPQMQLWVELLRRANHPYLYYIDDHFFALDGDSPLAQYYRKPEIRRSLEVAIANAYQVLTNSEILAAALQRLTGRLVVLPAFFDFSLIDGCVPVTTAELRIGFAGSTTRGDDLELVKPVIEPVLELIPEAVFEFAGLLPHGVRPCSRVRFFAHTDSYAEFIRFKAQRGWSIGLAPLLDTVANRSKTNNKYREYSACGIAGVYSEIPPYVGVVRHGENGLLATADSAAWQNSILQLALNEPRRLAIAARANADARAKFCLGQTAGEWGQCLLAAHAELRRRKVYLRRAHVRIIATQLLAREVGELWLQVKDAYSQGGVLMVARKTVGRVGATIARAPRRQ